MKKLLVILSFPYFISSFTLECMKPPRVIKKPSSDDKGAAAPIVSPRPVRLLRTFDDAAAAAIQTERVGNSIFSTAGGAAAAVVKAKPPQTQKTYSTNAAAAAAAKASPKKTCRSRSAYVGAAAAEDVHLKFKQQEESKRPAHKEEPSPGSSIADEESSFTILRFEQPIDIEEGTQKTKMNSLEKLNFIQKKRIKYVLKIKAGDPQDYCILGQYYACYSDIMNYHEAIKWFERAEKAGNCNGMYYLGLCFYHGCGIIQNIHQATLLFDRASKQGHAKAAYMLALCYIEGKGIQQDINQGINLLNKAIEHGLEVVARESLEICAYKLSMPHAQYILGKQYLTGKGIQQSCDIGLQLLVKASQQNHQQAQAELKRYHTCREEEDLFLLGDGD